MVACQNFDGGFGTTPGIDDDDVLDVVDNGDIDVDFSFLGAESHSGQSESIRVFKCPSNSSSPSLCSFSILLCWRFGSGGLSSSGIPSSFSNY